MIDLKKEYQQAWLTLKKYNEIYEYECIKQLIDKFIINNDTKIKILVELDNWKNEFIKISNSVYAIEDPNFVRIFDFGCDSTDPSISIYSSSDSEWIITKIKKYFNIFMLLIFIERLHNIW